MEREERKYALEAVIVMLMKRNKVLSHTELVNEVPRELQRRNAPFTLSVDQEGDVGLIEERIADLVGREYMEPVPASAGSERGYRYLP